MIELLDKSQLSVSFTTQKYVPAFVTIMELESPGIGPFGPSQKNPWLAPEFATVNHTVSFGHKNKEVEVTRG